MRTRRAVARQVCRAAIVAALPFVPSRSDAATSTWTGASPFSNNWSEPFNWNGLTPPLNNGTADLVFGGFMRTSPAIDGYWAINSLTISAVAAPFTFTGSGMEIRGGGIANLDTDVQTFNSGGIFFQNANTINAAAGPIDFNCLLVLGAPVTVSGSHQVNFDAGVVGNDVALTRTGTGTLVLGGGGNTEEYDLVVGGGIVNLARTSVTTFDLVGSVAVNSGQLRLSSDLIMDATPLTCSATGVVTVDSGVTLRITNEAHATFAGDFQLHNPGAVVTLDRSFSRLDVAGTLSLSLTTLEVTQLAAAAAGTLDLSRPLGGIVNVDGSGSGFHSDVATYVGGTESSSRLTLSNGGFGFLSTLTVGGDWSFPSPTVLAQTSGDFWAGAINIATTNGQFGVVTVTGTGSTGLQTGASGMAIGSSSGSAALNVTSGGVFTSGTGATTVHPSGTITISASTYNANGDLTLRGQLTRDTTGIFNLAAGKTMTVTNGGDATFTGPYDLNTAATILVTGSGSTLTSTGYLRVLNGGTLNAANGGLVTAGAYLDVGVAGNGSVLVDGTGSRLVAAGNCWWGDAGSTASVTFSNNATALITGSIDIGRGTNAGTVGNVTISSGAKATLPTILIAAYAGATHGSVTVTGNASRLTQSDVSALTIGAGSASVGTLNVSNGAVFTSGTGVTTVNKTGAIDIAGGYYQQLGNITLNGGRLTRDATGSFGLSAGKTWTIQNDGDAIFTGNFDLNSIATINVTGAGSTLSTTGSLRILNLGVLNILNGADVTAGEYFAVADMGNGTVVVDGVGSTLTTGAMPFGASHWGDDGYSGSVTFSNGSAGNIGSTLEIARSNVAGTAASVLITSGADVSFASISLATGTGSTTGTLTVTGVGSTAAQAGTASLSLGAASGSTAKLNVMNQGTFTTGVGPINVNKTADLTIDATGVLHALGNVVVEGSIEFGAAAGLHLSAGRSITLANGGELIYSGSGTNSAAWPIVLGTGGGAIRIGAASAALLLTGPITGPAELTLQGQGTLSLSGAQDYDALTVEGGTLNLLADLSGALLTTQDGRLNVHGEVTGAIVHANSNEGVYFSESEVLASLAIGNGGLVVLDSALAGPVESTVFSDGAATESSLVDPVPEPASSLLLLVSLPLLYRRLRPKAR